MEVVRPRGVVQTVADHPDQQAVDRTRDSGQDGDFAPSDLQKFREAVVMRAAEDAADEVKQVRRKQAAVEGEFNPCQQADDLRQMGAADAHGQEGDEHGQSGTAFPDNKPPERDEQIELAHDRDVVEMSDQSAGKAFTQEIRQVKREPLRRDEVYAEQRKDEQIWQNDAFCARQVEFRIGKRRIPAREEQLHAGEEQKSLHHKGRQPVRGTHHGERDAVGAVFRHAFGGDMDEDDQQHIEQAGHRQFMFF